MEPEKILAGLVRVGTVTFVDADKRMARVKFQGEEMTSGLLHVLQHHGANMFIQPDAKHNHPVHDTYTGGGSSEDYPAHDHLPGSYLTYWMPKINDTVLVLYLPVWNADGFILGGIM